MHVLHKQYSNQAAKDTALVGVGRVRHGKTKPRTCGFSLHLSFLLSFSGRTPKKARSIKERWFLPFVPRGGPAHTRSVHQRCNSPALACARCSKRITSVMEVLLRTSIHGTSSAAFPCGDQHLCQVTPIRQPSSPSGCGTNGPRRACEGMALQAETEKFWIALLRLGVCFPDLKGRWPRQGSCAFDHWLLAWSPGR